MTSTFRTTGPFRNTGPDKKGVVTRDIGTDHEFNFTYYGGGFEKSDKYKEKHLKNYDPVTGLCTIDGTMNLKTTRKMESWNTYQQHTWYQDKLNHVDKDECPPGVRAEFRQKGVTERAVSLRETAIAVFDVYNEGKFMTRTRDNTSVPLRDRTDDKFDFINTYEPDGQRHDDFQISANFVDETFKGSLRPESPATGDRRNYDGTMGFSGRDTAGSAGEGRVHRPLSANVKAAAESRMRAKSAKERAVESARRTTPQPSATTTLPIAQYPNPKTMFLNKVKPIFGLTKAEVLAKTGKAQSSSKFATTTMNSARASTAPDPDASGRSVRFSATNEDDGLGYESQPYSATSSSRPQTSLGCTSTRGETSVKRGRTMSGTSITRRHMGVAMDTAEADASIKKAGQSIHSKLATITNSTRGTLSQAIKHLHPSSGYERGLRGTLYANFWREEELMRGDGKICFHPLSYDVLETLVYGPADPTNNMLKNDVFVSLFLCLVYFNYHF
jgi:hypothetical protein